MQVRLKLALAILILFSANGLCATVKSVETQAGGVHFDLDQAALTLYVINDHIIRVVVSPIGTSSARVAQSTGC